MTSSREQVALDVRIRPATVADAGAIARVGLETWQATYAGLIPAAYLESLSADIWSKRRRLQLEEYESSRGAAGFALVAIPPDGGVAGYVMAGPRRNSADLAYAGEVYALYVRPSFQRRQLGRGLLSAAAQGLLNRELGSLLLWVLAGNPAHTFYEQLGGRPLGRKLVEFGGRWLEEVCYGWPDARSLLPPTGASSQLGRG